MATDANIITSLPVLKWKGLVAPPYDVVTFDFENRLAPRSIPYVDGTVHDDLGREAFPMTARLYFCNGLEGGPPGVRLFPEYWEQWKAKLDGTPGDLVHPILGRLRARVKGAKGELRATVRSGVIIDITWTETLEQPAMPTYLSALSVPASTLAANADTYAGAYGVTFADVDGGSGLYLVLPSADNPFGVLATTLADALSAITGAVFTLATSSIALLARLMGDVSAMVDLLDAGSDPGRWQAENALISFWLALYQMSQNIARAARPTKTTVVANDISLQAFAASVNNQEIEVIGLNPAALRAPVVRRGTPLTYYLAA